MLAVKTHETRIWVFPGTKLKEKQKEKEKENTTLKEGMEAL